MGQWESASTSQKGQLRLGFAGGIGVCCEDEGMACVLELRAGRASGWTFWNTGVNSGGGGQRRGPGLLPV